MTGRGLYKERAPGSLKEAEALLVMACNGQKAAAELTRVSRAQIGRYTDDSGDNENCHMPADIVLVLEKHCGDPIVTRFLAGSQNHGLIDLAPGAVVEPYPLLLAKIGRETGRLFSEAASALAAGGRIDPKRAGHVRREALDTARALFTLVADIDRGKP